MKFSLTSCVACGLLISTAVAQTFQRLGACPSLGCIFPPDQADFLPGQWFDIRLEVHAPQNGSERVSYQPDRNFSLTIAREGQAAVPAAQYFNLPAPNVTNWNFTWYEDLFAQAAGTPSLVQVAGSAYRKVALYEPGNYIATLTYQGGQSTVANWTVRDIPTTRRAKNAIMFIGDGMTTNMITAARLIAHQTINGKYQSLMAMDKFPVLGHQVGVCVQRLRML